MIEPDGEDVLIRVKAVPGASRDEVAGTVGDRLKVRVTAAPEGGKANRAICRVVAAALGVKPGRVSVQRGHASFEKTLRITGCDAAAVRSIIR
jgi:uncharacterized protein (TIGR00251 family)